jgi:homoserine kinase
MNSRASVRVRVPASSANLGPGFDVFGVALTLYNEVQAELLPAGTRPEIIVQGEGESHLPRDARNLVWRAFQRGLGGKKPRPARLVCVNRIPLARGLGSSSAAIVAGLAAGNALGRSRRDPQELFRMAVDMEDHPDNVAPAFFGGFRVSLQTNGGPVSVALPRPQGLKAVLCIPDFELSTEKARAVLPRRVSRADAIYNVSRAALFTAALAAKDFRRLGEAMEDRLHQPFRARLVPGLGRVIQAARRAGAFGAALSGAGPSVVALAPAGKAGNAGRAMARAFRRHRIRANAVVLDFDFQGTRVWRNR